MHELIKHYIEINKLSAIVWGSLYVYLILAYSLKQRKRNIVVNENGPKQHRDKICAVKSHPQEQSLLVWIAIVRSICKESCSSRHTNDEKVINSEQIHMTSQSQSEAVQRGLASVRGLVYN